MVIILMGASGAGKTTVGQALARELQWRFVDADDLHPAANVAKMRRSEPLTEEDREPWLAAVRGVIDVAIAHDESIVIACSALKERYRSRLAAGEAGVHFVYLKGSPALLEQRLASRSGHFAGPGLLASQLASLEEPTRDALTLDASEAPDALVAHIRRALDL